MRRSIKKAIAMGLSLAMAMVAPVLPGNKEVAKKASAEQIHAYTAYLQFQTGGDYSFRDSWYDKYTGLDAKVLKDGTKKDAEGNCPDILGEDGKSIAYDFENQYVDMTTGYSVPSGKCTNVQISGDGEYSVKIDDIDLKTDGTSHKANDDGTYDTMHSTIYNLLGFSTNIVYEDGKDAVKITNARLVVDGVEVASLAELGYNQEGSTRGGTLNGMKYSGGYLSYFMADSYAKTHKLDSSKLLNAELANRDANCNQIETVTDAKGNKVDKDADRKYFPEKSIEIKFNVSGMTDELLSKAPLVEGVARPTSGSSASGSSASGSSITGQSTTPAPSATESTKDIGTMKKFLLKPVVRANVEVTEDQAICDDVEVTKNGTYQIKHVAEMDSDNLFLSYVNTNLYNESKIPTGFKMELKSITVGGKDTGAKDNQLCFGATDEDINNGLRYNIVNPYNGFFIPDHVQAPSSAATATVFPGTVPVKKGDEIVITFKISGMDTSATEFVQYADGEYPAVVDASGNKIGEISEDGKTITYTDGTEKTRFADSDSNSSSATKLSVTSKKLTIAAGKKKTVKVTTDGTISVSSANKKVATVKKNSNKKITISVPKSAKKGASTNITVKAGKKTAKIKVTVANPVKKLKAKKSKVAIKKGKTAKVVVKLTAANKSKKTTAKVKATSSKKKVAKIAKTTVSKKKVVVNVKGLKKGKSKIVVKSGSAKATVNVIVK